jgi:hypothetical protein
LPESLSLAITWWFCNSIMLILMHWYCILFYFIFCYILFRGLIATCSHYLFCSSNWHLLTGTSSSWLLGPFDLTPGLFDISLTSWQYKIFHGHFGLS